MDLAEFERRAAAVWDEIPEDYRSGVDGLVIRREPHEHPSLPEIYTLGECLTETYLSDWGGPDTTRSILVLYYGSFARLSRLDPDFDWEYEIWETITHELRHHLESLAAEDALEDVDYAVDENFKRLNGEPFDPFFYRSGEPLAPGVWQAERDIFVELEYDPSTRRAEIELEWGRRPYALRLPEEPGDVTFIQVLEGVDTGAAELCVVLVRRRGLWSSVLGWLRRDALSIVQAETSAEPRAAGPDR